jgi:lysophospholipase L1-like esterase
MKLNRRIKEASINLAIVIATLVICLLLFEAYFAVFNPQTARPNAVAARVWGFYKYDELLGWRNKPGAAGVFSTPEFSTSVTINSKGLRDKEREYKKPAGIKRVIVLGDSFTWGWGVEEKDKFTEILNNKLPSNYEVINMGVSGYGTDQELLTLEREGLKYNPDLVIVAFHPQTDLEDNISAIRYSYPKPLFVLSANNTLSLTNVPVPKKEDWLKSWDTGEEIIKNDGFLAKLKNFMSEHSHTYLFFSRVVASNPILLKLFQKIGLIEELPTGTLGYISGYTLKQHDWDLTKALFREIDTVAKNNGARTLIFIVRYKYTDIRLNEALDKITAELVDFGKQNDLMVLDYLPTFIKYTGVREQLYFKHDGHWNADGHRTAAEAIYEKLKEEGLIQK